MSPRKSSTSSGRPRAQRPRYLGLEVAGEHLPLRSSRDWEAAFRHRLDRAGLTHVGFRLIRSEGARAVVELEHLEVPSVRKAFKPDEPPHPPGSFVTVRTWGTLVGAKAWLRSQP